MVKSVEAGSGSQEWRLKYVLEAFLSFTTFVADYSNDPHVVAAAKRVGKEVELKIARDQERAKQ